MVPFPTQVEAFHAMESLGLLFKRMCLYCAETDVRLEIGPILPKRFGGADRLDNLALPCQSWSKKNGRLALHRFSNSRMGYIPIPLQGLKGNESISTGAPFSPMPQGRILPGVNL